MFPQGYPLWATVAPVPDLKHHVTLMFSGFGPASYVPEFRIEEVTGIAVRRVVGWITEPRWHPIFDRPVEILGNPEWPTAIMGWEIRYYDTYEQAFPWARSRAFSMGDEIRERLLEPIYELQGDADDPQ